MIERIKALSHLQLTQTKHIREHLHMHPELSFKEYNTTAYILKCLTDLGIQCEAGPLDTGVVAYIKGRNASSKTIALRADIDALPIQEISDNLYKSKQDGIMHACGHDVHTACLIGAAAILEAIKVEFEGTVKLIFQPGEEVLPGGAKLLIEKGILKQPEVSSIFGQHVHPSLPAGKVGIKSGMFMASTDELHIKIIGKGGHAAMPNDYSNPIVVAAKIVDRLTTYFMTQDTVSKSKTIPTVFAIGDIQALGATNVIPDTCNLKGTFRTMDEAWRKEARTIITNTIETICKQNNATADIQMIEGYPVLFNHEDLTNGAKALMEAYLGKEQVVDLPIRMTAEDFAYYSQAIPACFYRLGTNYDDTQFTSGVHTSNFDIHPHALKIGSGLMAWIAYNQLI
jgi:amidohydrolase